MMFIFVVAGLLVGSFLNVVLTRLETEESFVSGRSRCDSCRETIRWYDNVPVLSHIVLRGKCRYCGVAISRQHLIMELSTATMFALAGAVLPAASTLSTSLGLIFVLGLIGVLAVVFVHDLMHMEIPVSVLVFGIVWTVVSLFLIWISESPAEPFFSSRLWEGIIGGAIAFLLFYSLVFFSDETWMGMGDAWLALILGLALGWKLLLPALTLAFGSGAVVGIVLIVLGRKGLQSRIPFGPFLAGSVIVMLIFGTIIGNAFGYFLI
ncbi:MAG: prepilin peptidase [Candidatus Moranbacteria bacterium]|nr:prepilin peptidase [Candidatus Moranbacteria bacterium]